MINVHYKPHIPSGRGPGRMPCRKLIPAIVILVSGMNLRSQYTRPMPEFDRQDTLRGSVSPERAWWKLTYYHLDVEVFPQDSSLSGSVTIRYRVLSRARRMQVDLQPPMKISRVEQGGKNLPFEQDGNAWFISLRESQPEGALKSLTIQYGGRPKISSHPPWDGGFTWKQDSTGKPFIATSNQGDGASLWWPCKDHMYEEPDSMLISVTTPGNLMDVSNGRLRSMEENTNGTKTWNWFVSNPISNYVVNINIADYAHFGEVFKGELGDLDCNYYVLPENLERAKEQFIQAPLMLKAFEHWYGPYPFYEDGYKLVEVPYTGMEHQSSVTYGNGFENGYRGRDISGTGWGAKFDFIIIHESGHEWFANNITYRDVADMWIHEGFAAYSEGLYVEYYFGKAAGFEYLRGVRSNIRNDRTIIGKYDVNYSGSGDMYPKGANMLHTIRQIVDDDEKWRGILRGLNHTFWHQVVTTQQIEIYLNGQTETDLRRVFDQYLRDTRVPTFEYRFEEGHMLYRWTNCVRGFNMPLKITLNGEELLLKPRTRWSVLEEVEGKDLKVNKDYYVAVLNTMGD